MNGLLSFGSRRRRYHLVSPAGEWDPWATPLKRKSEIMLKRSFIAAATAVALAGAAFATAAPAAAGQAGFIEVHGQWPGQGQWNGPGQWHGGKGQWHHGKKKYKQVRRSCDPVIRWVWRGHHKKPIVVGWRCDFPRRHHWNPYW
jgi:hypothetical protein